jgi:hypothetical protein
VAQTQGIAVNPAEIREPGQEQVKRVAVGGKADRQSPYLAVAQEVTEHRDLATLGRAFASGAAGEDIVVLGRAEPRVPARVAIDD